MPGIEWFGIAMSILLALSLVQKNVKWLRILNLLGAAGFSTYGFLIHSWPVAGLNAFICFVDIFYLVEMVLRKDSFSHFFTDPRLDPYCMSFTMYYKNDMKKFQNLEGFPEGSRACFIMRNMIPVSLIIFKHTDNFKAEIILDYATPSFRDFRSARYFQTRVVGNGELKNICELETESNSLAHTRYLKRIGFSEVENSENRYSWKIS